MAGKPAKPYTEVESAFIRGHIIDGNFDDPECRHYVNELVQIESFVQNGVHGFGSGMKRSQLANAYPEEYDIIHEELDPEGHAERKRRKAEAIRESRENEDPEVVAEARRDWELVSEDDGLPF